MIRGYNLERVIRPGKFEDFLNGRISPYSLERSLRDDVFVDEKKRIRPTVLLGTGNSHKAVGKIMKRGKGRSAEQTLSRLLEEAKMQANLQHPGIASHYAVVDFPNDELCMTLREYVQGESLQEMIVGRGGRLPANSVAWVLYQVLQTVEYLQVYGQNGKPISHGGITPNNIIITNEGIKLTDFSLAKLIGGDINTFAPTGSRDYRAPEQNIGDAQAGTDLWGAGVTAIVALLGHLPEKITKLGGQHLTAYRLPDRAAPEQLKLLLEKIVQKDYDARGTASDALDHLIEQRLVEDGLLSQKGIIETVESKLRERLGAKQRPKSHDEVIAFRHLRLASTYARMRNEQGMKLELDAADYSARLAGKDIESQVTGTYQLFDASVIDYAKQIIKNVVVIDGKTLEGLSETPDGRDFRQIVPTLHYMIQIVFQRENLPLTPERTATIDQYFHQRVSEEVKMYIDTQLNTLGRAMQRREGLPQIGRINQKLAEYRSLAEATGARWDQEEVQKLVFNK